MPKATGVSAESILAGLRRAGTTHVVIVPDTNQKTVLASLDAQDELKVLRCAAEDDVFGVCAGLWLTGWRPVALIQQLGLFAGANSLRGMVHDQGAPLAVLAGIYGRDVELELNEDPGSAVRLCTPVLDALELRWTLISSDAQVGLIESEFSAAFRGEHPSVVLLGAPTT